MFIAIAKSRKKLKICSLSGPPTFCEYGMSLPNGPGIISPSVHNRPTALPNNDSTEYLLEQPFATFLETKQERKDLNEVSFLNLGMLVYLSVITNVSFK